MRTILLGGCLVASGFNAPELAPPSRVRLEARGREMVDVINLLAKAAGVKVFIHPEVEGRVTVKIEDLPFEEALSLVLSAKGGGYSWRKLDGVYHIGRFEGTEGSSPAGETVTETVRLRYRDARSLARLFGYVGRETLEATEPALLYPLLPKGLATPPQPVQLENALTLSGSPDAVAQMAALLRQIDRHMPLVAVQVQALAVPAAVVKSIKLHWERHPKLRREGAVELVFAATRDFGEVREKLFHHREVQVLGEAEVTTEDRAPAHLQVGRASRPEETVEAVPPPLGTAPAAPPPVQPGQWWSLVPCIEPGNMVQLWFHSRFEIGSPAENTQGEPMVVWAEGIPVPPGESLALYLPPSSAAESEDRTAVLIFLTPRVVEAGSP